MCTDVNMCVLVNNYNWLGICLAETRRDSTIQAEDRAALFSSAVTAVDLNRTIPLSLCAFASLRKIVCKQGNRRFYMTLCLSL